jgi:hypothetical protein
MGSVVRRRPMNCGGSEVKLGGAHLASTKMLQIPVIY